MVSTESARNVAELIKIIQNPQGAKQPDLKVALRTLAAAIDPDSSHTELARAIRLQLLTAITLPELFTLLVYPDEDVVEVAVKLVEEVLEPLPFDVVLGESEEHLRTGLAHMNRLVRQLALRQVAKSLANKANFQQMLAAKILPDVLRCLEFPDSVVAQTAMDLLIKIANDEAGLSAIFAESEILDSIMRSPPTVKLRLYEVGAQIAIRSDTAFDHCVASGVLDGLVAAIGDSDILIRVNALEILGTLAQSRNGSEYIERAGVLQTFAEGMSPQARSKAETPPVRFENLVAEFNGKPSNEMKVESEHLLDYYIVKFLDRINHSAQARRMKSPSPSPPESVLSAGPITPIAISAAVSVTSPSRHPPSRAPTSPPRTPCVNQ